MAMVFVTSDRTGVSSNSALRLGLEIPVASHSLLSNRSADQKLLQNNKIVCPSQQRLHAGHVAPLDDHIGKDDLADTHFRD